MSQDPPNRGITVSGGNNTGNNFATGDYVTQTSSVVKGGGRELTRVTELVAQIRAALPQEPDPAVRADIEEELTGLDQDLASRQALGEHAWRERLLRAGKTMEKLSVRATRFAAPLAQLVAAIAALNAGRIPGA